MNAYVLLCYGLVFAACLVGSFNQRYRANTLQSIGLAALGLWSMWRMIVLWTDGVGFLNEPVLSTALMCHSIGTVSKTIEWMFHDIRRN